MRPFETLAAIKGEDLKCFNEELLKEFICFLGLKGPRHENRVHGTILTSSP
jgi:hypothetical protein